VAETVVALQVVVSRTSLLLELLLLQERKSMIDTRNRVLGLAAATIPATVTRSVAPTSAARAFRSTSVREWLPWDLEKKKTVAIAEIVRSIIESIIGSIGTIESGVIAGDIDATIRIRIQIQTAIITTGTRDGAKAREM
jgi:hypothetical protein